MSILSFKDVSKKYGGHFGQALQNVSFKLHEGDFAALSGPSGSGKTTILNLATGLDAPTEGCISLLQHNLLALSRRQMTSLRRHSVGFVFQSFNLFPVLNALENVEYPLALNGEHARDRKERAEEILVQLGLDKFMYHYPGELSGGQQQRVAIARAIVTRPRIVFADEPTASLDSKTSKSLLELLARLNEELGISFLFSTHDPLVLSLAKRIIRVVDGKIAESHTDD